MPINNEKTLDELFQKYTLSEKNPDKKNSALKNAIELVISTLICEFRLKPNIDDDSPLSIKEVFSMILLAAGESVPRCAKLIGISPKSMKTYERRIRRKLSAKNRTNAFYIAQVKGYISLII